MIVEGDLVNPAGLEGTVRVDISPIDVLNKMEESAIMSYMNRYHNGAPQFSPEYYKELAFDYFHGDFDLVRFFCELGPEAVMKARIRAGLVDHRS